MEQKPHLYFRRAVFLPFVVCALGALTWQLAEWAPAEIRGASTVASGAALLTIVHLVALGPYAVCLLLASRWIARAHPLREIHVAVWVLPLLLALGVAGAVAVVARLGGSTSSLSKAAVWGAGAALVGYAHAVLIEVGFLFGRKSGLIRA